MSTKESNDSKKNEPYFIQIVQPTAQQKEALEAQKSRESNGSNKEDYSDLLYSYQKNARSIAQSLSQEHANKEHNEQITPMIVNNPSHHDLETPETSTSKVDTSEQMNSLDIADDQTELTTHDLSQDVLEDHDIDFEYPTLTFPQKEYTSLMMSSDDHETRVVYLVNDTPTEFFFDRTQESSLVGNIYKGRVVRVLPGMQAAFVDIGLKQAAFLYIDDIAQTKSHTYSTILGQSYTSTMDLEPSRPIQEVLQEGQELMVQVSKDSISTKGARVTNHISIAGRHLVYIPSMDHIGVSRRIIDEDERGRLKELLEILVPQGGGFVARTAAEDCSLEDLREDLNFLRQVWNDVLTRMESSTAPATLHEDLDLPLKATRDLVTPHIKDIIIDHPLIFNKTHDFIKRFMPEYTDKVQFYQDTEPLFERYGVDAEINRALSRKVWLPSGGYLIIDQTEALTSIDVNSGRFVGKYHFEETIYRTNMEAIYEIVSQLQLRNIGGIIILDLIDMERSSMRHRVHTAFVDALKQDRAKTNVSTISGLGLIEMTRKRIRDSLLRSFCDPCIYCQGNGFLKSPQTLSHEIYRDLLSHKSTIKGDKLCLEVHQNLARYLEEQALGLLHSLEETLQIQISIVVRQEIHPEAYHYYSL